MFDSGFYERLDFGGDLLNYYIFMIRNYFIYNL